MTASINLEDKFALFDDTWAPKVIAAMNDYQIKLVKLEGEFVWHCHADTDELFLCVAGEFDIEFRDGVTTVKTGELCVVPKGVEHKPVARAGCQVIIIEPTGVMNTGNAETDRTAPNDDWI